MTVRYVFNPGAPSELELTDDDIISHNPVHTHTGKGDWELEVPYNRDLDQFIQRKDRLNVYIDGSPKFAGYCKNISHDGVYVTENGDTGTSTRIRGDGIAKRLEETRPDYESLGGSVTYSNIALDDAIEDYWSRTPFDNYTVYDQQASLIAEDVTVHEADTTLEWQSLFTFADDNPLEANNGELTVNQVAFTQEGEDYNNGTSTFPGSPGTYSNGDAALIDTTGDFAEWEFELDYTIPEEFVGIQIRDDDGDSDGSAAFEWELDGNRVNERQLTGINIALSWSDITGPIYDGGDYTGGDLTPGTHTLRVDCPDGGDAGDVYTVDVICVYDTRYESELFFDDNNGGSDGYLDGPELYPESVEVESSVSNVSYNIVNSTITSVWDDTSNNQSISVSNDGGSTYTTFNNTNTVDHDYTGTGRAARFKLEPRPRHRRAI